MEEPRLELEHHQLDLHYERLRLRREVLEPRLVGSLAAAGQQVPIVVVARGEEPGRYRVIDGFRRVRALARLGRDTVWATVWELPELDALLLSRGQHAVSETALEQGWLLTELTESFGLDGEELARRLDRSASWVSRRLALVRVLPAAVQEAVREGRIAAHAAMRHLVPLARAKPKACAELAEAAARQRLSSRETGELVRLYCRASRRERPRLLADPHLALRAHQILEAETDERDVRVWLRGLEALAPAIDRLRQHQPELEGTERQRSQTAVTAAGQALEALELALRGESPC